LRASASILRSIELVGELLHRRRLGALGNAIVERLERDASSSKLTLEVLVTVEAELAVVREVGAELDEERTEVAIDAVEVVLVDHRGRLDEPRVALPAARIFATLGPDHRGALLRLADEENALLRSKLGQVALGDIVLALVPLEGDEVDALTFRESLDGLDEFSRHRGHQRGRGEVEAAVVPEEPGHALLSLKDRDVQVAVHPVDALELQGDVLIENFGDAAC
jgi:hypothetical protein